MVLAIILILMMGQSSLTLLFANPGAGKTGPVPLEVFGRILVPVLVITLISLAGSIPISLKDTSRMVMERRLLPLLLLSYTLCQIKIIPLYSLMNPVYTIDLTTSAIIYQFALIFSAFLVFTIGLFQQGINMFKVGNMITIGALASLLLATMAQTTISTTEAIISGSLASPLVMIFSQLLQLIAIGSFISIFFREKTRHNALRCGGFILMIVSNMAMAVDIATGWKILGLIGYATGVLLVSPILQTERM